jgi:methyltransferase-like protein
MLQVWIRRNWDKAIHCLKTTLTMKPYLNQENYKRWLVRSFIVVFRGYMWFTESKDKPNKRLLDLQAFSKKYFVIHQINQWQYKPLIHLPTRCNDECCNRS